MDILARLLERFFDVRLFSESDQSILLLEYMFLAALCLIIVVVCCICVTTAHQWHAKQGRYVPPLPVAEDLTQLHKRHNAEIIDFASASQRVKNQRDLHRYTRLHPSIAQDVRNATSADLDNFVFKDELNGEDDGPKAA
jgi:hypothetical protein